MYVGMYIHTCMMHVVCCIHPGFSPCLSRSFEIESKSLGGRIAELDRASRAHYGGDREDRKGMKEAKGGSIAAEH